MEGKRLRKAGVLAVILSMIFSCSVLAASEKDETEFSEKQTEVQTEKQTEVQTEPQTKSPSEEKEESQTENKNEEVFETQTPETQISETQSQAVQDNKKHEEENNGKSVNGEEKQKGKTDGKESRKKGKSENKDKEEEEDKSGTGSNESFISQQNIVMPEIKEDFRFEQTDKAEFVLLKKGAVIREGQNEETRAVGKAKKRSKAYILKNSSDGWFYVESGRVRGFVKKDDVITGDRVQELCQKKGKPGFMEAFVLIPPYQNKAVAYTKTTVRKTVVKKKYAIAKMNVKIYESKNLKKGRIAGTLEEGAVSYILADGYSEIMYVESGDVRGFVKKSKFITGEEATSIIEKRGEDKIILAEKILEPQENAACYYTITSTAEADSTEAVRNAIVDFAVQFVGNPYVWGGTSLTDGADCSGFVQSIYSYFGFSLPRVACDQAGCGTQIPVSEARPGDLIFYAQNGYVYHVSMCIGDGRVVQAANSSCGIITSGIAADAVWAVNILD